MTTYLLILPVAILVAYSQLVVKWRSNALVEPAGHDFASRAMQLLSDPAILSAYTAAFIASFAWLYVATKLPLAVAFPVYIGTTFFLVLLGGWLLLGEQLSAIKIVAALLILLGIVLGIAADA